jgi:hypothetical protein
VRLSPDEVVARRDANRRRLARLLHRFEGLGTTPVLLSAQDPDEIYAVFLDWSERRSAERGRVW